MIAEPDLVPNCFTLKLFPQRIIGKSVLKCFPWPVPLVTVS